MRRAILVALGTGVVISSAAAIGIGAVLAPPEQAMTRAQYESARTQLAALRVHDEAGCETVQGVDAEVCRAQARAADRVRTAELESQFRRTERAAREAQRARIDARYEVERARCEGLRGYRKDKCLIMAHATKGRALLEAAAPYEVTLRD